MKSTRPFVLALAGAAISAIALSTRAAPPQYRVDVLQPIQAPPSSYSAGWGVQQFGPAGSAVGSAAAGFDVRAVRWMSTTPQPLSILPGWTSSVAAGANTHRLIVGS